MRFLRQNVKGNRDHFRVKYGCVARDQQKLSVGEFDRSIKCDDFDVFSLPFDNILLVNFAI